MSTEARLQRLGLSHLANNPSALQQALDERIAKSSRTPAELAHLNHRLPERPPSNVVPIRK